MEPLQGRCRAEQRSPLYRRDADGARVALPRPGQRLTEQAYGWSEGSTDAETIAALTGLNRVREVEEARGHVRWLRPEFQRLRNRGPDRRPGVEAPSPSPSVLPGRRPAFPKDRYEQPLVIQASLVRELGPIASHDLARRFSGGVKLAPRIDRVLTTLHRYGHVERLSDGRWISARG